MNDLFCRLQAWHAHSELAQAVITVPLLETTVLFAAITFCLLFRYTRAGLILTFVFIYRWGWMVQLRMFSADPNLKTLFAIGYLAFGLLVLVFTVLNLIFHSAAERE